MASHWTRRKELSFFFFFFYSLLARVRHTQLEEALCEMLKRSKSDEFCSRLFLSHLSTVWKTWCQMIPAWHKLQLIISPWSIFKQLWIRRDTISMSLPKPLIGQSLTWFKLKCVFNRHAFLDVKPENCLERVLQVQKFWARKPKCAQTFHWKWSLSI